MAIDGRDDRDAMERLDRFLDHIADRTQLPQDETGLDPALTEALRRFQAQGNRPNPNPLFVAHLEKKLMDIASPAGLPSPIPPLIVRQNGHLAGRRSTWIPPTPVIPKRTSWFQRISSAALFIVVLLMATFVLIRENPSPNEIASIPMFRGGAARTGEQPGPGPHGVPTARWTFTTAGKVVSSQSVADGLLFAGADDGIFHAIDAKTGVERWQAKLSGAIGAAPAIVDGTVYVGDQAGHLYAFDAATGAQRWIASMGTGGDASLYASAPVVVDGTLYLTSGSGASSPAVLDGVVYVGGDASASVAFKILRAFDATTGVEKWHFSGGASSVSLDQNGLYAVDAATGIERWHFATAGYVHGAPAVANGMAYVGSKDGTLSAVDIATGESHWTFKTGKAIYSSPAVVGGVVYIGSTDGNLYALDGSTGTELWHTQVGLVRASSPAVVDDAIYIVAAGSLVAVDESDGTPRWSIPVGDGVDTSPVVSGGLVFVGGITQPDKTAVVIALGDKP